MQEYEDLNEKGNKLEAAKPGVSRWMVIAMLVMLGSAGLAVGYGYQQQVMVGHLTAQQTAASATINDMQGQLSTVTAKLNDMTAAQAQLQAQAAAQAEQKSAQTAHGGPRKTAAVDKRYKQLRSQLDEQQKQLKDTQDLVAKNRTDLEGNLSSTRDELNGSIAKTHEELVVLQKRGERSYTEFDLTKSKQFQRFGPLTLCLRRADSKHMNYDMAMVVDDNQLSKKR